MVAPLTVAVVFGETFRACLWLAMVLSRVFVRVIFWHSERVWCHRDGQHRRRLKKLGGRNLQFFTC